MREILDIEISPAMRRARRRAAAIGRKGLPDGVAVLVILCEEVDQGRMHVVYDSFGRPEDINRTFGALEPGELPEPLAVPTERPQPRSYMTLAAIALLGPCAAVALWAIAAGDALMAAAYGALCGAFATASLFAFWSRGQSGH